MGSQTSYIYAALYRYAYSCGCLSLTSGDRGGREGMSCWTGAAVVMRRVTNLNESFATSRPLASKSSLTKVSATTMTEQVLLPLKAVATKVAFVLTARAPGFDSVGDEGDGHLCAHVG